MQFKQFRLLKLVLDDQSLGLGLNLSSSTKSEPNQGFLTGQIIHFIYRTSVQCDQVIHHKNKWKKKSRRRRNKMMKRKRGI